MTTEEHPITPPPLELVDQWDFECGLEENAAVHIATQAARWGADQQLERDATWLDGHALFSSHLTITPSGDALRQAMRPPLSLKEQALQALANADGADHPVVATVLTADEHALIRRALESLPN